jgi:hypothetical protein
MRDLAQRREIGVIGVVIFDQDALVLQPDDGDAVPVVLGVGRDAEAVGGARAVLLARRGRLAPVKAVDGPYVKLELVFSSVYR